MALKTKKILLVGTSGEAQASFRAQIEAQLKTRDDRPEFDLHGVGTFRSALEHAKGNPDLNLVVITNFVCMSDNDMRRGCQELAAALSGNTGIKVVINDPDDAAYADEFRKLGVRVEVEERQEPALA